MVAKVGETWWDAYVHSIELQAQQTIEQHMYIRDSIQNEISSWQEDPKRAVDFASIATRGTAIIY